MSNKTLKDRLSWVGLACAVTSLAAILYIKKDSPFQSSTIPSTLLLISMVTGAIGLIVGILTVRRWQSIIALLIAGIAAYRILFTPLYSIA
jgi:hypothetical protein